MNIDVSVVVPVYNCEKYINKCTDSLLKQTLKNVELIFVDDGSMDRSVSILREYQKGDARIQIIQQKNQGAGTARNSGLMAARGKYIVFLDADDFFESQLLEEAFSCAEKNQAEVVLYDSYVFDEQTGKRRKWLTPNMPVSPFSNEDLGPGLFSAGKAVPWNKLVLRQFLIDNRIIFQEIRKSNDLYYSLLCVSLAKRLAFIPKCLVNYRVGNPNSLQGNINTGMECGIISRMALKRELVKRNLFQGNIKEAFYRCCSDLSIYCNRITNIDSMKIFYQEMKKNLVPGLYDSNEECSHELFHSILGSDGFEVFLFTLYLNTKNQYVSKSSAEYRLGNAMLALPKRILRK